MCVSPPTPWLSKYLILIVILLLSKNNNNKNSSRGSDGDSNAGSGFGAAGNDYGISRWGDAFASCLRSLPLFLPHSLSCAGKARLSERAAVDLALSLTPPLSLSVSRTHSVSNACLCYSIICLHSQMFFDSLAYAYIHTQAHTHT